MVAQTNTNKLKLPQSVECRLYLLASAALGVYSASVHQAILKNMVLCQP